ncbi:hypothetical protein [Sphingobacterium hotanense]|uniref:hypothetical protein n=1 Tax=Sphingobacterium hotanense TaxID=649196 RepID=UPI0011F2A6AB|nr:hypothetical protein [Sphingobacterium hotanense]
MSFGLTILSLAYILFLIVPGIVFKRFFYQNNPQKLPGVGNFADRIITSLFCGFIIQIITILLFTIGISQISSYEFIDYYRRLINIHEKLVSNSLPVISTKQIIYLLLELLYSLLIAATFGLIGFNIIRKFKLDVIFPVLRFDSEWKYLFRDDKRIFDDDSVTNFRVFDSAQLDLIVKEASGDSFLYSGILYNYKTNKEGSLEFISLLETKRYTKSKDTQEVKIKAIPGHVVIIPYSNVLNMNVTYFYRTRMTTNRFIESMLIVFITTSLLPIIILPWFSSAPWYWCIASILLLLLSWSSVVGLLSPFIGNKKNNLNLGGILILILTFLFSFYGALSLLNIDLFQLIKDLSNK